MTPTQKIKFLGMRMNTNTVLISLPADKVKQIWAEVVRIANMTLLTAQLLSHFLGNLSMAIQTIPQATLFYCCLHRGLHNNSQNYEPFLSLSQAFLAQLSWWREHLCRLNGKPLRQKTKSTPMLPSCAG